MDEEEKRAYTGGTPFGWGNPSYWSSLCWKISEELAEDPPDLRTPQGRAIQAALDSFEKGKKMNTQIATQTASQPTPIAQKFGFTEKQLDLVKRTVAKGATDDELELFFYRCKELQLNPLLPGQVHFIKFGNNPGTVIIGLDGFRARAQRTGKLGGIKRGVIRDEKGQCIGAWADVYHKDWNQPAHEEVSLVEYADYKKPTWKNMPETMIKKVAEVAALRMAFPDECGGIYLSEEMDQAQAKEVSAEMVRRPSEAQIKRIFAIAKENDVSTERLKQLMKENFALETTKDLSLDQYNHLCDLILAKDAEAKTVSSEWAESVGASYMDVK